MAAQASDFRFSFYNAFDTSRGKKFCLASNKVFSKIGGNEGVKKSPPPPPPPPPRKS